MGKRLLYTAIALLAGATLGVLLFAPGDVVAPNPPGTPTPTPSVAVATPSAPVVAAPELVTLHDVEIPTRRSPGWLDDHNLVMVQPGDRDLRVVAEYESGTEPGITWPFVTLLDPAGAEAERCSAPDCDWTIADPAPGQWIVAVGTDGSWALHLTVTLVRAAPIPAEAVLGDESRVAQLAPRPTGWLQAIPVERDDATLEVRLASTGAGPCGATANIEAPDGGRDSAVIVPQTVRYPAEVGRWVVTIAPGTCTSVSVTIIQQTA